MRQVVFIHGGSDFKNYEDFLESLKTFPVDISELQVKPRFRNTLAERLGTGFEVLVPNMPNKENAKYAEWKIWFERMFPFIREGVILIGHSLGGVFLARYLSENTLPHKIGAVILLAAPYEDKDFTPTPSLEFQVLGPLTEFSKQASQIFILHSEDDPVVPFAHAEKYLAELPEAKLQSFTDKGHFSLPEFPELIELIKSLGVS
jgi:predicted alpha/beta hydrolase family esterase